MNYVYQFLFVFAMNIDKIWKYSVLVILCKDLIISLSKRTSMKYIHATIHPYQ